MFDAGAIEATLTLNRSEFNRQLLAELAEYRALKKELQEGVTIPVKFDGGKFPFGTGPSESISGHQDRVLIKETGLIGSDPLLLKKLEQEAATPGGIGIIGVGTDGTLQRLLRQALENAARSDRPLGLVGLGQGQDTVQKIVQKVVSAAQGGTTTQDVIQKVVGTVGEPSGVPWVIPAMIKAINPSPQEEAAAGALAGMTWAEAFQSQIDRIKTDIVSIGVKGPQTAQDLQTLATLVQQLNKTQAQADLVAASMKKLGADTANTASDARIATTAWAGWGTKIALANGLLGSTTIVELALHAALDTAIALIGAAVALGVTLYNLAPAAQDVYTHLQAVSDVNSALGSNIPPLRGQLQSLQQAMAPSVIEDYGGALNLVNNQTGAIGRTTRQVAVLINDWIAKLDIWSAKQNGLGTIMQHGVGFLQQFGDFVKYVALAFDNLIKSDPGVSHFFIDALVGVAKLLDFVTKLPAPLLAAALGLHAIWMWGGVAVTALTRLAGAIGLDTLAAKLGLVKTEVTAVGSAGEQTVTTFLGLGKVPWALIIAGAAALGYFAYEALQADKSATDFVSGLQNGLQQLTVGQAIPQISADIGQLNDKIQAVKTNVAPAMTAMVTGAADAQHHFGSFFDDIAHGKLTTDSIKNAFDGVTSSLKSWLGFQGQIGQKLKDTADVNLFKGAIVQLTGQQDNLFKETGKLIKQGHDYAQAVTLMDLAGVKANDSFAVMDQKVKNLITGYANMGVRAGLLENAVNAITFSTELQNSNVQTLTSSYSSFIGVVTGAETALTGNNGFLSGLTNLGTQAGVTGASLDGLNSQSLTLRGTFEQEVSSAVGVYNALTTQAAAAGLGAQGYNLLTGAGKDLVGMLLNTAKGSYQGTQQLYALAQLAGYHGVDSFKALSKWVGNTSDAEADLNKKTSILTGASANLLTDVNNLANAVNQNLNTAIASAIFQATGGQKAFDKFADSVLGAHGNISKMIPSAESLIGQLFKMHETTQQAHDTFFSFAYQLGLTKGQADRLWQDVLNNLDPALRSIKTPPAIDIILHAKGNFEVVTPNGNLPGGTVGGPFAAGGLIGGLLGGMRVPGHGSNLDDMLITAQRGEAIIPRWLVPIFAPLLASYGIPGFVSGGIVPGYSGSADGLVPWWRSDADHATADYEQYIENQFVKTLKNMIAPGVIGGLGGGVTRWAGTALQAMGLLGIPSGDLGIVLSQMATESGGNPYAVNLWDSNAAAGIPSTGLMQVVSPTYAEWGAPWFGYPPPVANMVSEDPLANIFAGLNYATHEYGANWVNVLGHGHGYASGGMVGSPVAGIFDSGGILPNGTAALNYSGSDERVLSPADTQTWDTLAGGEALLDKLDELIAVTRAVPKATSRGVGAVVGSASRSAVYRGMYTPDRNY